jgi:hypothetical protein
MARATGAWLLATKSELNRLAGLEVAQTRQLYCLSLTHQPLDTPCQFIQLSGGFRLAHAFPCGEFGR